MRGRLLWKLLSITLLVLGVGLVIIWMAIDYLAADYFMALMQRYNISPTEIHQMFIDTIHRYLLWSSLVALGLTGGLSVLLTRQVLRPLTRMIAVTRRIADGDYTVRVWLTSNDEVGQLGMAFDQMAESLQNLEQLRRTMVNDVAHELRTPLTNMRGYLEALHDGVLPPSEQTFEMLHEEILRLAKLVEDLLQLVRADAARVTLRRQVVSLRELIEYAVDLFQAQWVAKDITVETRYVDGMPTVFADSDKILQVLRNLLQNAVQYTPPGGQVRVAVERETDGVRGIVVNTGEGIPAADLPFIFERFYRGERSRSREHGGAGIGLAIVKELIEAHGGQVGAQSTPAETRIWFTLPR